MTNDESIQLVSYNKEEKIYKFNKEGLQRIIEENEVQDLPVSVISVAGLFRKGKSFLLNFFLCYLHAKDRKNWLSYSSESLKGFEWRGGRKRNTEGIHIWSKIFKLQTADGNQVAVMLMDTQGTFDGKSSNKTGAIIFALSALVSSVQVYNLSQQINEDDLENLLWFTQYASSVQEETEQKSFQSLWFLVRDWPHYVQHSYGEQGGKNFIDEILQTTGKDSSLTKVRNDIRSTFEKLSCFLLPYPGQIVATDINFNGKIKDIDEEFITHIRDFVPSVLSPENLVVKKVPGLGNLIGTEFVELFNTYLEHYNSDELPDERSKAEAAADAYYAPLVERCVNIYKTEMTKMLDDYLNRIEDCTSQVFENDHERIKTMAMNKFSKAKVINNDIASSKKEILTARIQEQLQILTSKRSAKYKASAEKHYNVLASEILKEYKKKITAILDKSEEEIDLYTPTAYAETHETNKSMAIEKFCEETRFCDYDTKKCLDKLTQDIDYSFGVNESRRKSKFKLAATSFYYQLLETCIGKYNTEMLRLMDNPQLVMRSFARTHENSKRSAINEFSEAKCHDKDVKSKYLRSLRKDIGSAFGRYQEQKQCIIEYEKDRINAEKEIQLSAQQRDQRLKELQLQLDADKQKSKDKLDAEKHERKLEFDKVKLEQANEAKRIDNKNKEIDNKAKAEDDKRKKEHALKMADKEREKLELEYESRRWWQFWK